MSVDEESGKLETAVQVTLLLSITLTQNKPGHHVFGVPGTGIFPVPGRVLPFVFTYSTD